MIRKFSRIIDSYQCQFQLGQGVLSILLRSVEHAQILASHFGPNNMPDALKNILSSPQQFYSALINVRKDNIRIDPNGEMILRAYIFELDKAFVVNMDLSCHLSQEHAFMQNFHDLQRETQREDHRDIFATERKNFTQVSQNNQNQSQSRKEMMLSQLNCSFAEDIQALTQENNQLEKQLSHISHQKRNLEERNSRLTQEKQVMEQKYQEAMDNSEKLVREKERLVQLISDSDSSQGREEKKSEVNAVHPQSDDSLERMGFKKLEYVNEEVEEYKEIKALVQQRGKLIQKRFCLSKEIKKLLQEIKILEQKIKELKEKQIKCQSELKDLNKKQ